MPVVVVADRIDEGTDRGGGGIAVPLDAYAMSAALAEASAGAAVVAKCPPIRHAMSATLAEVPAGTAVVATRLSVRHAMSAELGLKCPPGPQSSRRTRSSDTQCPRLRLKCRPRPQSSRTKVTVLSATFGVVGASGSALASTANSASMAPTAIVRVIVFNIYHAPCVEAGDACLLPCPRAIARVPIWTGGQCDIGGAVATEWPPQMQFIFLYRGNKQYPPMASGAVIAGHRVQAGYRDFDTCSKFNSAVTLNSALAISKSANSVKARCGYLPQLRGRCATRHTVPPTRNFG